MSKQQNVANCTSHHSLHILDVLASWALLCSGPVPWFEEDFTRIFFDMKTQNDKQICVIANQDRFARHCRFYACLYNQDICITTGMTCWASNVFQAVGCTLLSRYSVYQGPAIQHILALYIWPSNVSRYQTPDSMQVHFC